MKLPNSEAVMPDIEALRRDAWVFDTGVKRLGDCSPDELLIIIQSLLAAQEEARRAILTRPMWVKTHAA
jgi:hypothetical protein